MNRLNNLIVLTIIAVLIIIAFVLLSPPRSDVLKVGIFGRAIDSKGETNIVMEVTNASSSDFLIRFEVQFQKDGKWLVDKQWNSKSTDHFHFLDGHEITRFNLPAPIEDSAWRFFIVVTEERPDRLRRKWLDLCEKIGLKNEPYVAGFYLDPNK